MTSGQLLQIQRGLVLVLYELFSMDDYFMWTYSKYFDGILILTKFKSWLHLSHIITNFYLTRMLLKTIVYTGNISSY